MVDTQLIIGIVGASFCGGLILASILISCSFSIIEIEEYGLLYNNNDKSIESRTYNSTRDFVGLGKKYRTYPSGLVDLDFSSNVAYTPNLACWSQSGVNIYLSLGFYLKLNRTAIYDIYMRFGGDSDELWQMPLIRAAMTAVKETTVKYDTLDFFTKRETIKENIWSNIQTKVDNDLGPIMKIKILYFTSVQLDSDFEASITNKLIQLQELRTYQIKQEATQILKANELIEVYADNNITIIEAEAKAKGTIISVAIDADIFSTKIINEAKVYKEAKTDLSLANDKLLKFLFVNELSEISPSTIIINPQNTVIQLANVPSTTSSSSTTDSDSDSDSTNSNSTSSSSEENKTDYGNSMIISLNSLFCVIYLLAILFSF